jgi:hypothetical protein
MSSQSRINLKTAFASGTAATQSKFEDLIDSSYNTTNDSVLMGPIGLTGTKGLVGPIGSTSYNGVKGPDGATHYLGLWLDQSGSTPGSSASTGSTGQVVISGTSVYVCGGLNSWILIGATTTF